MCVTIHRAAHVTTPWDPVTNTITIPAHLTRERELIALRAVLGELAVNQPASGAVCWCGQLLDGGRVQLRTTVR